MTPIAVHATYSLDNHDGLAKQQRFREAGLWRVDPPSYFEGKFLAYNATPSAALRDALASFKSRGKKPNNIKTHAMALADHLAGLRDALALARALRRTLVLPRWTCYCDRLWSPSDDIFHFGCMYPGAQDGNFLPFDCPMDHVLDTPRWFENDFGVGVREPSFLSNPRVPANVSGAVAKVKLPKGLNDKEVAKVLGAHASAGVIEIDDPVGTFCGFDDGALDRKYREVSSHLLTYRRTPFCMMEGSDNAPLFSQCCSPRKPGDKFFPCVHGFNDPPKLPECAHPAV